MIQKISTAALAAAVEKHGSYTGAANHFGVTRELIRSRCRRLGIESPCKPGFPHPKPPKYVRKPAISLTGLTYDALKGAMSEDQITDLMDNRMYDDDPRAVRQEQLFSWWQNAQTIKTKGVTEWMV